MALTDWFSKDKDPLDVVESAVRKRALKEFLIREGVRWRDLIEKAHRLAQQDRISSE